MRKMTKARLGASVCVLALIAGSMLAADGAAAATNPDDPGIEIVVVTASRGRAADLAPVKSSLDTTEPQSVISRKWIENSSPDTGDYSSLLVVAPSVSAGVDNNGPGLSEAKFTLRGFGDGQYNIRYDGIPFGDTNDPTHHSTAFFPASTVGAITIDRGPGQAGDLGQESLGGSVDLFSRTLSDDPYAQQKATYGSWDTRSFTTTLQSGKVEWLGDTRITANFQELQSNGALSLEKVKEYNQFLKFETPLGAGWMMTFMGTHNSAQLHKPDNDGITLAQAAKYGKNFTLSNDPTAPTYYGYNTVYKHTDFEYLKFAGPVLPGVNFDTTGYTYSYINHTESATTTYQSANDIAANTYPGWGTYLDPLHGKTSATPHKTATDVGGYDKNNSYRVWGDISRLSADFDVMNITGQIRAGFWYEFQNTDRHRYYADWTAGFAPSYNYSTPVCATLVPACPFTGATQFNERSAWYNYEPFFDLELHPVTDLTVLLGYKYVAFNREINALVGSSTRIPTLGHNHYNHDLPYLQANYHVNDDWSVYAQYAQGFLIPPLSSFYVQYPSQNQLRPQTSTSYQIGTVYNVDAFSFDADLYYVRAANAFQSANTTVPGLGTFTYFYNGGAVDYKGIEGEATYAFGKSDWDQMLDGLAVFGNGSLNDAESPDTVVAGAANADYHHQIKNVPKWTAAAGLIYSKHDVSVTLVDKFFGEQWAASGEPAAYKIPSYSIANFIVGYEFGPFKIQGGVYNLFDDRSVTSITVNSAAIGPTAAASDDQFFWLPERSFQITFRATLD